MGGKVITSVFQREVADPDYWRQRVSEERDDTQLMVELVVVRTGKWGWGGAEGGGGYT